MITHNNGDTSTNLLSENPDTETAENQNTEITTEESRQQYKVTTGGTRLNIRKEPRADAEILQKLGMVLFVMPLETKAKMEAG